MPNLKRADLIRIIDEAYHEIKRFNESISSSEALSIVKDRNCPFEKPQPKTPFSSTLVSSADYNLWIRTLQEYETQLSRVQTWNDAMLNK